MHVLCCRDRRKSDFQDLNGRNVGANDAMIGALVDVQCSEDVVAVGGGNGASESALGHLVDHPRSRFSKLQHSSLFMT